MTLRRPWRWAAIAAAAFFFALALSNDVYQATSPSALSWHVALRKAYSIVAFAIVGWLFRRALEEGGRRTVVWPCVLGVALYSAAIEVAQYLHGSTEGLGWNAIDVLCGAIGGALAVGDRAFEASRRADRRRAKLEL